MSDLKIIVPNNFLDFGMKVNEHIKSIRDTDENFIVNTQFVRFNNGEGKAVIKESIRDKDLYIMSDVSNYDDYYKSYGRKHYMGPDEHFQDIKRVLSAECGHAAKRTVIMPYLYESRQDKKNSRESLDCAMSLKELEYMGVNEVITCDVHNKSVLNAVPNMATENLYLSDMLIWDFLINEKIDDFSKLICIFPDEGAMKRAVFFSELFGAPIGSFYKQRDYTRVIEGSNPIVNHSFFGPSDMRGKYAVVVDDMIASGGSILDTATSLKKLGVERVYLMVTFALFTQGVKKFDKFYKSGIINRVYATNVSYVPKSVIDREWFKSVDCSYKIANLISEVNYGHSIGELIDCRTDTAVKIKKLRKEYEKK